MIYDVVKRQGSVETCWPFPGLFGDLEAEHFMVEEAGKEADSIGGRIVIQVLNVKDEVVSTYTVEASES
jgi:hypothetical protein